MYEQLDRHLAHLVQMDPRISWARAGRLLDISPTTAAHRWQRLADEGLVWVTTFPNLDRHLTVIVEVDCRTESLPSAIATLCAHSMVVSVDETTGRRDLVLTIVAPDLPTLSDLVIDWIGSIPGVYNSRSAVVTAVAIGTESWRVNGLNLTEAERVQPHQTRELWALPNDELDQQLVTLLAKDGRASASDLARQLDVPTSTLHRHLQKVLASRQILMRCDVAPELGNWTMECTWMATVAFNHKVRVLELLKQHPSLRSCLWVTGSDNLRVNFRVPHHGSIAKIEAETAKAIPGLAPTETIVHYAATSRWAGCSIVPGDALATSSALRCSRSQWRPDHLHGRLRLPTDHRLSGRLRWVRRLANLVGNGVSHLAQVQPPLLARSTRADVHQGWHEQHVVRLDLALAQPDAAGVVPTGGEQLVKQVEGMVGELCGEQPVERGR